MDAQDEHEQQALHEAIEAAIPLDEGHLLTGWVLCYEALEPNGDRYAGSYRGPRTITQWLALGIVHWAIKGGLEPDPEDAE